MGYTFKTLQEALKQSDVTIRKLPPPPVSSLDDARPQHPSAEPSLADGLPEFSPSALARFLVRFIVADDQVFNLNLSNTCNILSLLTFLQSINVIECPEFR
jgi:hypothetical protein